MSDSLNTVLTQRLGCQYPILQTAMGWVATPPLVVASVNAGAFGFLGAAVMTPRELDRAIATIRTQTERPFGVNFHSFQPHASEIVAAILANRDQVRAVSFGRGPDAQMIRRFQRAGILCIPTVGAVKHAQKMASLGVDMITVQGGEGGGHTGSVATTVLLPQVLDAVNIPVIAAGGFSDGRGLAAALAYGAVGVAMGTRFLMTQESPVPERTKACYVAAGMDDIVVSTKIDGLPMRMVRNALVRKVERSGRLAMWLRGAQSAVTLRRVTGAPATELLRAAWGMVREQHLSFSQAMLAASAPALIRAAVVDGNVDIGVMAAGSVAGRLENLPSCGDLIESIVEEALQRLAALSGSAVFRSEEIRSAHPL